MATDGSGNLAVATARRRRSPNYPAFGLEESIKKAKTLYEANDEHYAPWEAAAQQLGYSPTSSSLSKAIGAMSQFGLIVDQGAGENRQIKVSDRLLDIVIHPAGSEKHIKALQDAALDPALHDELWEKYGGKLPPKDDAIRIYLLREREVGTFNRATVDAFIEQFRNTLAFSGISSDDSQPQESSADTPKNGNGPEAWQKLVRVGSFVQWTSQGVDRFPDPQRVTGIEGDWAFVEGSPSGLPMSELSVVDPPASPKQPPANPFYQPPKTYDEVPEGVALDRATLDEGPVVLRWPEELSKESVEEFEYWVNGLIKRAKRKAGKGEATFSRGAGNAPV